MNKSEQIAAIAAICERISAHAKAKCWTEKRLCREYPDLGDDRTYRDLKRGLGERYETDKWLKAYTAVDTAIQQADAAPEQVVCRNTSAVQKISRAVQTLIGRREGDNRRVLIVVGASGMGKTTAKNLIIEQMGARVAKVQALQAWRDKPMEFFRAILRAVGDDTTPADIMDGYKTVAETLTVSRKCVFVEDCHFIGPRIINNIIPLIDQTRSEFVLMGIPKLLRDMFKANREESTQIFNNRLSEVVRLEKLSQTDPEKYLNKRFPDINEAVAKAGGLKIYAEAVALGNMSFIVAVADALPPKTEITHAAIEAAIADAKSSR